MTTADILADIGAIDANLLSLPIDELERMGFYVQERDKLLRKLESSLEDNYAAAQGAKEGLCIVSQRTQEIKSRIQLSREQILESMHSADRQLRLIDGFRQGSAPPEFNSLSIGRILSRVG
jgi:hypothetical protein